MNAVRSIILLILLSSVPAGCAPVVPGSNGPTSTPEETEVQTEVVSVYIYERSDEADGSLLDLTNIDVGQQATMQVVFQPAVITQRGDYIWFAPTDSHDVAEMRLCTSSDGPCELTNTWVPFTAGQASELTVDWLGRREFHITVQFRDADGSIVPAVKYGVSDTQSVYRGSYAIIGVVDEETPVESLPPAVQTALAPTPTPSTIWGSVAIEGGGCCVGGTEGSTISVSVDFEAWSPSAEIEAMRVLAGYICFSESEMDQAEWEPFEPSRSFPVKVSLNWSGFYVSVQYRDAEGNVSPVYCDDIGVEGAPASQGLLIPSFVGLAVPGMAGLAVGGFLLLSRRRAKAGD